MTSHQSWTIEKTSDLVLNRTFFSIIQLWRLVFLEPVGVQRHYVAHLKALINAKVDLEAQGRGSTINICHAQLKKAILHLKTATVRIFFCLTVLATSSFPKYFYANLPKGSFKNHVGKMRWVGGWTNVHDCPREVGRWSCKCPRGQNSKKIC